VRRLYRVVLLLCPSEIRRAYAAEMEEVFVHCVETEAARRGRAGLAFAYARGFADALAFAIDVRSRRRAPAAAAPTSFFPSFQKKRRSVMRMRDVRETLRFMRKQPVLAGAIVMMLALGLGASTAIFSVVYGVLLKPLPFPDADRVVQISGAIPSRQLDSIAMSEANFWDMHDAQRTFADFGAWHYESFSLTGSGEPLRVNGAAVTVGFLRALGVQPVAGRLFVPGEDDLGAPRGRAVLSHGLWTSQFGADRGVVGRTIVLDGRAAEVIGVLPSGTPWLSDAEVFIPFVRRPKMNRGSWEFSVVGRLKPEVGFEAAFDDLRRVARDLEVHAPNRGLGVNLERSEIWIASDQIRRTLWMLLGSVGLLLLIGCVNVTNLLLARATGRIRESAVRAALGAGRGDLVRERLTESLVLSAAGAALGWLLAIGILQVLRSLNPAGIPRLAEVELNMWAVLFAAAATLVVGVVTGLAPAWHAPMREILPALRHGGRGTAGDRRGDRVRATLVAAEVALSLMLLIGAGLLVRSLTQVLATDRGFQTERRMLVTVSLPGAYGEAKLASAVADILQRLEALPEMVSVALVSGRPLSAGNTGLGIVSADDPAPATVPWATWRLVTKDYFRAIGLTLLSGRGFTEQDLLGKPWRVIVSKRLADQLWPGQNPVGRTALLWKGQGDNRAEIIGVVSDMRERGLEADPTLAVYIPAYGALATTTLQLVMHTKGQPEDVFPSVRSVVAGVDPNLPISGVRTLDDMVARSVATRRFTMLLLATFAGLALVLALAGVYGVLAYSVARRTPEIGVRLALGAQQGRVLRLMLGQGLRPVLAGAAIGLALSFWLSRVMATLLFGIQPTDVTTYVVVSLALIATAFLASYLPARQVLRVDPVVALRND
jgi:predicted permease